MPLNKPTICWVYTASAPTERMVYIFTEILERRQHLNVLFINDISNYATGDCLVWYAPPSPTPIDVDLSQCFCIENPSELLHQSGLNTTFSTPPQGDPFAECFWHLSRYEEYLLPDHLHDKHQRFPASMAYLVKNNQIQRALVDEFANTLANYWKLPLPDRCQVIPTFDLDVAWFYLNKGWARSAASFLKQLLKGNLSECLFRLKVMTGTENDPAQFFHWLLQQLGHHNLPKPKMFVLMGKLTQYDTNNPTSNKNFQALLKQLNNHFDIGIHPSYASQSQPQKILSEKNILESIINKNITASRQHFIKLKLPNTYQTLLQLGIKEDYSMGYPDTTGYRASTALPFYWFNLNTNKATSLLIHPFVTMDVTLKNYEKKNTKESENQLSNIKNYLKKQNLPLCFIWHNNNLSHIDQWQHWQPILINLLKDFH
jgi:hypothetical protein